MWTVTSPVENTAQIPSSLNPLHDNILDSKDGLDGISATSHDEPIAPSPNEVETTNDLPTNALHQSIYPRGDYSLIQGTEPMHTMKKNSFQQIRLTEDEYNGHPFLDVRIYVKGEGGKYYPTRQGLAVPLERITAFANLVEECCSQLEKTSE